MWEKICLYEAGKEFIWSDGWCFDNDEIWFIAGDMNVLFHMKESRHEAFLFPGFHLVIHMNLEIIQGV